jgi:hypothetical protein
MVVEPLMCSAGWRGQGQAGAVGISTALHLAPLVLAGLVFGPVDM